MPEEEQAIATHAIHAWKNGNEYRNVFHPSEITDAMQPHVVQVFELNAEGRSVYCVCNLLLWAESCDHARQKLVDVLRLHKENEKGNDFHGKRRETLLEALILSNEKKYEIRIELFNKNFIVGVPWADNGNLI